MQSTDNPSKTAYVQNLMDVVMAIDENDRAGLPPIELLLIFDMSYTNGSMRCVQRSSMLLSMTGKREFIRNVNSLSIQANKNDFIETDEAPMRLIFS